MLKDLNLSTDLAGLTWGLGVGVIPCKLFEFSWEFSMMNFSFAPRRFNYKSCLNWRPSPVVVAMAMERRILLKQEFDRLNHDELKDIVEGVSLLEMVVRHLVGDLLTPSAQVEPLPRVHILRIRA
ncbi:hypothetical protein V6N11_081885 [Hibiscus sabdariffa]|uniref:Uncharacterized protein n=1 Tax=Hibiscus sabdariffa TaxID=183260 RepID=A0ABR2Q7V7_9ROSI